MRKMSELPVALLHETFRIDDSGNLFWKTKKGIRVMDKPCGVYHKGYLTIKLIFEGKRNIYYAHRIAWAMQNGRWPDACIDHINGNGLDNSKTNLRLATQKQNGRNRKTSKNNTSGAKNVFFSGGKWKVQVRINDVLRYFGKYDDFELAELVAQEARRVYFGEFACEGR